MKFTHLADAHIGSYRDELLRDLSTVAFCQAIDWSIAKGVDFILIAGDLFNTALPGIENLKRVTQKLHEVRTHRIPVYLIAGSHDFSPSGKTMLDVLEEAGLVRNVMRGSVGEDGRLKLAFTIDPKTGAKLTGILGKRGTLDKAYYESLDRGSLESEEGFKIFLFHTTLTEYKPEGLEDAESSPISLLPRGFDYYAGGHVHYRFDKEEEGYGLIVYPGPLFPNSFSELEDLGHGGFCYYEDGEMTRVPLRIKDVVAVTVDAKGKGPEQVTATVREELESREVKDRLVLVRLAGRLARGKTTDVNLSNIFADTYARGAYFILKSTTRLETEEFVEIKALAEHAQDIEELLIKEHAGQIAVRGWDREEEMSTARALMRVFALGKSEGEKSYEFESRLLEEADMVLLGDDEGQEDKK